MKIQNETLVYIASTCIAFVFALGVAKSDLAGKVAADQLPEHIRVTGGHFFFPKEEGLILREQLAYIRKEIDRLQGQMQKVLDAVLKGAKQDG